MKLVSDLRTRSDTQFAWLSPDRMIVLLIFWSWMWSRIRFLLARYPSHASTSTKDVFKIVKILMTFKIKYAHPSSSN